MQIKNKTIENAHLKKMQRLHALCINWFVFTGVIIAILLLILGYSITIVELSLLIGMWFVTEIGITVGFHRFFTHRSFQATKFIRITLAILGSMAAQGTVIFWASLHRLHHEFSDKPGDPHSPYFEGTEPQPNIWCGFWHSYIGWTTKHDVPNPYHYAPDLLKDPIISKINRLYFLWVILGLLIPTILGGIIRQSWFGAFYGFLWGGAVRMWVSHNLVWSITSIAHIIGNQDYQSEDRSKNNIWIAIPTLGESWHNTHHAFPYSAVVGWKWWQMDISGWIILILEKFHLVWDVKQPTAKMIENKKITKDQYNENRHS